MGIALHDFGTRLQTCATTAESEALAQSLLQ